MHKALKDLKQKKSRDPNMYANEIFQPQVAGKDLIKAILKLMNRIKNDSVYPKALTLCNITSIYKHKGSHNIFSSYRGIFRVQALRNILERLLYNKEYSNIDSNLTDANVGARQKRNIRDNIFVLNAVMNETIQGTKEPVDITVYEVEKCFDALWVQECINDMYKARLQNNKLNILYLMNQHAEVVIKTSSGNTTRTSMSNLIMQGTVWGSLFCTVSMDKLPMHQYENRENLYKYRGVVSVPSLEMVDDIIDIKKCGKDSVISNAVINSFIEHKKLTMGKSKCHKIHCGQKSEFCQDLKVHDNTMHNSNEETYLGDQITANGKHASTIAKRRARGYGIISDILLVLEKIYNSERRIRVGLELRQAWFVNSMLLNVEAWHNMLQKDMNIITSMDKYLVRKIINSHSKAPVELLYLETGTVPVEYILASRRLNYFHTIITRNNNELTKQIYTQQKENPVKGDRYYYIIDSKYG